ncbi:MAG TPA: rod shape-determining protein MreC [Mycobacteriales bacterium]|nr:rod shape-determining protein MreC [Mycobacteriales bacterium]
MLTILLLAAFTLITLDYRSGTLNGVRNVAEDVFGPIEDVVDDVTHPIGSWFSSVGHLGSYKHQNQQLKNEIAKLQSQLHLTALQQQELHQLQGIFKLASIAQYRVVASRVTAFGGGLGSDQTVTIDRGSANGIAVNETVIDGDGLVGRTITVGRNTSTVLLADDPTFAAGARLSAKQLEAGKVQGNGVNQPMTLTLYSTTVRPQVNEDVVTLGDQNNTPFVPEVPIGQITKVSPPNGGLAQSATVKPFVDFNAIDVVAVVTHAPSSVKHDSLLPHPPKPTPTVTVTTTVTATPGQPPPSSPPASGGSSPAVPPSKSSSP